MVKEANIMLRVHSEQKDRIESAARATGRSVTDFVLEAVMKEVARQESKPTKVARGHLPTYFMACCHTASTGGTQSYRWVGDTLASHLQNECPYELEDEWPQLLDELGELLSLDNSDQAVIEWMSRYLPRFVELVPPRRRGIFIAGMRERYEQDGF